MGKVQGFVNSFTAGEIGPEGWERTDLVQHARGCAEASNLIVLKTGPLASRGGWLDRGAGGDGERVLIRAFSRSAQDALFLELGDAWGRVWTVTGDRILDGGTPYQFTTPWPASVLDKLWFRQIGDVIYVTRIDGGRTMSIRRLASNNWDVSAYDFREGPFLAENTIEALTLTPSAVTGYASLEASAPLFTPEMEESLVRIRANDGHPGVDTWISKTAYNEAQVIQFDGRVYKRVGGGLKSGTTPPVHSSGTVSDGEILWAFEHDGAGLFRIDSFVTSTAVFGTVVKLLPTSTGTRYWSLQAYSNDRGWPCALCEEREDRLAFGGSLVQPSRLDFTRTAGFGPLYGDFKPGLGTGRVVPDDGVRLTVGGAGARIVWMVSAAVLTLGTTDGEFIVTGPSMDDSIVPDAPICRRLSEWGSADIEPLLLQGPPTTIVHVTRDRRSVREFKVAPDQASESRELSLLASHIYGRGVSDMTHQRSENLIWFQLDDGSMATMAYHQEHQILASTRQPLPEGWRCESFDGAPGAEGRDVLLASMVRMKDGQQQRRIWLLTHREAAMFMDGAEVYDGPPTTGVTGLEQWAGETVTVMADGAVVGERDVALDGSVTGLDPASNIVVGQPIFRRFVSLPPDLQGVGSTYLHSYRPTKAWITLDCVEARVGVQSSDLRETVKTREPQDTAAPKARRARRAIALGGGADRDNRIVIESLAPYDLVIHALRTSGDLNA